MNFIRRCKPLLGTYVEINITADKPDDYLFYLSNSMFEEISRIHNLMSFHDQDSEVNLLNREAVSREIEISKDLQIVLSTALEISAHSNGAYDVTIASSLIDDGQLPDYGIETDKDANWQDIKLANGKVKFVKKLQIDLGGIAKGYAVNKAMEIADNNDCDIVINAGGDLMMNQWKNKAVYVKNPADNLKEVDLVMKNAAIATSASYNTDKIHSIFSSFDKKPINDNSSISVFASNCMIADALTKIVFLDKKNCSKILNKFSAEAVVIDEQGNFKEIS